jgi:hypothetical protein
MPNLKISANICEKGIDKGLSRWYTNKAVACGGDFIRRFIKGFCDRKKRSATSANGIRQIALVIFCEAP